jgi:hypothetical protein
MQCANIIVIDPATYKVVKAIKVARRGRGRGILYIVERNALHGTTNCGLP